MNRPPQFVASFVSNRLCRSLADFVEKVGVSTQPNFFGAVGAIFRCGRGGPRNPPQTQWSEFQIDLRR